MTERHTSVPEAPPADSTTDEIAPEPARGWQPLRLGERAAAPARAIQTCKRRDERLNVTLRATTTLIDPVYDPFANTHYYHTSEEDTVVSLARRGAGLVCAHPPHVGTRLVLQIHAPGERGPIEMIGRTCWTRVEYVPGEHGARAVAAIGVEFMGGSSRSLDRYERWLAILSNPNSELVATSAATG